MLGTGYYWVQRLIPSKKNQSVLIAKISSRKTHKITNPQKYKLPQKGRLNFFAPEKMAEKFHTF